MIIVERGELSLNVENFLLKLGELTYRYGLAINENGCVFLLEADDYESRYWLNADDCISFGSREALA
jgi:hypothetical protein